MASGAAGALVAALAFAGAAPAQAEPTDITEGLGKFLGGDVVLGGIDLDTLAAVEGANAEYPSGASLDTNPLSADVINTLGVDLTETLQLFGPNGIVEVGAVNQYAAADADGSAAASGAVSDQGAISVGGSPEFPADATVSLTPLIPTAVQDATVSQLDLTIGALSATADWPTGGDPVGDYQIAGATAELTSPLVSDVYTQLQAAIGPVQTALDGLTGAITTALDGLINLNLGVARSTGSVDVTVPDLTAVLPTGFVGDGGVQVNLQTGEVIIDIEQVMAEDPNLPDLNNLPPNYEILNGDVIAAISAATTNTITSIVEDVAAGVRTAIENTAVSVDIAFQAFTVLGGWQDVVSLSLDASLAEIDAGTATASVDVLGSTTLVNILLGALGLGTVDDLASAVVNAVLAPVGLVFDAVDALDETLNTLTTGLATDVVGPVLDVLTNVVSLTGNVQEQPGDLPDQDPSGVQSFTQRALSLELLSFGTGTDLATVNLASATVRSAVAPTITVDPSSVPAGGEATVTGTGFAPSTEITVQLTDPTTGDAVGAPVTVTTDTSGGFTIPLPVDAGTATGTYDVVATGDPSGIAPTAPLDVTAAPTITATPDDLPSGGTTTVTGTGFTPGDVTVQLVNGEGVVVGGPITTTADADGTISTPFVLADDLPAGEYTFEATDTTNASATDAITVRGPPAVTLDPTTVAPGGTTTATGAGYTPNSAVEVQLTDATGAPVGDPITVTTEADGSFTVDVPVPADAEPGGYAVVATDVSGAEASAALTVLEPAITATPDTVQVGGTTTIDGTGFTPEGDVVVQLTDATGAAVGDPVAVTADADGTITTPLPVPEGTEPGAFTVVATDPSGITAETALTVTPAPTITATPDTVAEGGDTTITGDGFTPGGDVVVQLVDADTGEPVDVPFTVTADGAGNITTPLTVPAATTPGGYLVMATDVTTSADATTGLTVTAALVPVITADPDTVPAGGTTTISGADFTPGETVTVELIDPATDEVIGTVSGTVADDGTFAVDLPTDAGTTPGAYNVVATDTGGATAQTTLTVTDAPTLTATPDTVPAGGTTTLTGEGFYPGDVTVQPYGPDGTAFGDPITVTAGADGTFTLDLEIPAGADPGAWTVDATDLTGATATTGLTVTAAPTIAADPTSVTVGESTTITGEGFTPNETVTVQLTDPATGDPVGDPVTVVANGEGIISVELPVDGGTAPGTYDVVATDVTGATAETPLEVTPVPVITADPDTVPAGGTTTVTSSTFTPGATVTVQLTDPATGDPIGDAVTGIVESDGTFIVPLPVDVTTDPGDYTIVATDDGGVTAETPLAVTAAPTLAVDPASVPSGVSTTVTGEGYAPGPVTVQLVDGTGAPVGDPVVTTAAADGTIEVELPTAGVDAGAYTVVGTDSTGASAEVDLTVTTPSVTLDPDTVPAGGTTTVTGEGFTPNTEVSVQLTDGGGDPVGDPLLVTTDADGAFTVDLPLAETTLTGPYTVVATDAEGAEAEAALTVTPAPEITASPATVPQGGTTTVTGEGFTPGEPVEVQLTDAAGDPVGDPITVTPDDDGTFAVDVPTDGVEPGDYTVVATDSTGAQAEAPLTVTAAPTIAVDPGTVPAGGTTTVTGEGFTPGEPVEVQLTDAAGDPVGDPVTVIAQVDGTIEADLTVPAGAEPGDYTVVATDSTGAEAEAPLTVTAAPTIATDPGTVAAGETTTVTGAGFTPGEPVEVQLEDADGNPIGDPVTVIAEDDGTIEADLTIPADTTPGDYTVVATDSTGAEGEAPLTVTAALAPVITTSPDTLPAGGTTTVAGADFTPGETVTVQLTDPATGEPVGEPVTATVGDDGTFSVDLPVDASTTPGPYDVVATDESGTEATAGLTVTAAPTIAVDPGSVPAGGTTTVTGEGFTPGEPVVVQLEDAEGNPIGEAITVIAEDDGTIEAGLTIPADTTPGDYGVLATDSTGAEAETPLTVTAALAPVITASPDAIPASGTTTIAGADFTAGETVTVQLTDPTTGEPVGEPVTATVGDDGTFSVALPVPAGTVPGTYDVVATDESGTEATTALAVTAAPTLGADPGTVPAGGSTTVTGDGFTPNAEVTLQLTDADGNPVGDPVTVTADADGDFEIAVPTSDDDGPIAWGSYVVVASDANGATATTDLTVIDPSLATPRDAVPAGGSTQVIGAGFSPDSQVEVQLMDDGGNPVGDPVTVDTDADGTFAMTLSVSAGAEPGLHTIVATDPSGIMAEAELAVTAAPTIAVDPTSVPAGGTTTVTGVGFTAGEPVEVQLTDPDGNPVGDPIIVPADQVDADGAFTVDVPVPADAEPGDYTVVAVGGAGATAEAGLTVRPAPTVTVDPEVAAPGDTVTATCDGFNEGEISVQMLLPDGDPHGQVVSCVENEDGTITAELVLPESGPPGSYTVEATGPTGATAVDQVAVVDPSITVEPDEVPAGGSVEVDGSGFTPGEEVVVEIVDGDGNVVGTQTVTADEDGVIAAVVQVPADTEPGDYEVVATDSTTGVSTTEELVVGPAPSIDVDPDTAQPGDTITVTCEDFSDGDVTLRLIGPGGEQVGVSALCVDDGTGTGTGQVTIPAAAPPGEYTVVATGSAGETAEETLTITAAGAMPGTPGTGGTPTVPGTGPLPQTGSSPWVPAGIAFLLILSGLAVVVGRRQLEATDA